MNFNTVFLTYGGWLPVVPGDTMHTTALPEWIGGCSVCWSPAIAVPASEAGECTCCGHVGPVLSGEDLMIHEIRWNSSKHLPGGPGMTYRKHWELARLMNVQLKLAEYLSTRAGGSFTETPEWVKKVSEAFDLSPLSVRLTALYGDFPGHAVGMEKIFTGLDGYAERARGLAESLGCSGSYSARKAFLEKSSDGKDNYPPHSFRSVIAATSKASEEEIRVMVKEYGIDLPERGAINTVHKNKDEDKE